MFFLPQTPVESPAEEEARELEYLRAVESPQEGPGRLRLPVVVAAEGPPRALHAVEKPQLLPGGSLKLHPAPSRNTNAAVAGILAVAVALAFGFRFVPYLNQLGGPGTPLSASLLISNEIL